jgi:hypothetical protein
MGEDLFMVMFTCVCYMIYIRYVRSTRLLNQDLQVMLVGTVWITRANNASSPCIRKSLMFFVIPMVNFGSIFLFALLLYCNPCNS